MSPRALIAAVALAGGCGRVGFEPVSGGPDAAVVEAAAAEEVAGTGDRAAAPDGTASVPDAGAVEARPEVGAPDAMAPPADGGNEVDAALDAPVDAMIESDGSQPDVAVPVDAPPDLAAIEALPPSAVRVLSGVYTGDGLDDRAIAGLGFAPAAVMVRPAAAVHTYLRTSAMSGDTSKLCGAARDDVLPDLVQSLGPDGFVVGTGANAVGTTYYWIAFATAPGDLAVGSYVGTGSPLHVPVGFSPAHAWTFRAGAPLVHRSRSMTVALNLYGGTGTDLVQSLDPDGFTLGNNGATNQAGAVHYYIAFRERPGVEVASYKGDGQDNRVLGGQGAVPEVAFVQCESASMYFLYMKPRSSGPERDESYAIHSAGVVTNHIQRLLDFGIEIGNARDINDNGTTCHTMLYAR